MFNTSPDHRNRNVPEKYIFILKLTRVNHRVENAIANGEAVQGQKVHSSLTAFFQRLFWLKAMPDSLIMIFSTSPQVSAKPDPNFKSGSVNYFGHLLHGMAI